MPSTFNPRDLSTYKDRRVLLLQGPVGPFFARLAADLKQAGATVTKVNFHAGDRLFYRRNAVEFRGHVQDWPAFLTQLLASERIDVVLLYGDCRPVHRVAQGLARERGLHVGVFEEGYLRPNHITLERWGVNGNSGLPRDPETYLDMPALPDVPERAVGNAYWHMVWWGFCYFTVGALGSLWHPAPLHHRSLSMLEGWPWLRSAWRKQWYRWTERAVMPTLLRQWKGRYFLVPLQVHNDSQITEHSRFDSVEHFITTLVCSFAKSAPARTALVFKHHPMDRGYRNYHRLIEELSFQHKLTGRVFYIHDQHLPTLLDKALGVVVINSTVGLQALRHGTAVKTLGNAIYNTQGLTHQGSLDNFWRQAPAARPNPRLLRQFVRHLKHENQINGSFYRRIPSVNTSTGIDWAHHSRETVSSMSTELIRPELSYFSPIPSSPDIMIMNTRHNHSISKNNKATISSNTQSAGGKYTTKDQHAIEKSRPRVAN